MQGNTQARAKPTKTIRSSIERLIQKGRAKASKQNENNPSSSSLCNENQATKTPQLLEKVPLKEDLGSGKSFWEQAAEKLEPKVRNALEEIREESEKFQEEEQKAHNSDALSLPKALSDKAQRRIEDIKNRQWALPIKIRDKELEIQKLLKKCLKFATVVKDKGDAFIKLDPTGYAKIAWIPFSLIVDLATVGLEQHHAALDAFSDLSLLICRYKIVESIYQGRKDKHKGFEECLVKLYGKVLECEVALTGHFHRNGFLQFLRSIPVLDDWDGQISEIKTLDDNCKSLCDSFDSRGLLTVEQHTEELVDDKRRREIQDILNWITDHDSSVDRKLAIEKAKLDTVYADAGKWLLENRTFLEWSHPKSNGIQPLWLHGPVGCGKTSLTTKVVEDFLERAWASKLKDEQVSYFYCSKTLGSGSKAVDILRSIVRQLALSPKDSQIEAFVKEVWKGRQSPEKDKLSVDECKKILLQLAERCSSTTIIIDALDECDDLWELLKALKELSPQVPVKLFLSGRYEVNVDLKPTFPEYLSIPITSEKVAVDLHHFIYRHVENECERYPALGTEEYSDLRRRLIDDLAERGKLAFRWTQLQLALFFPPKTPFNPEAIDERLNTLKERVGLDDLSNTYKEIYERNTAGRNAYKQDLNHSLQWVLACEWPLRIQLLVDAIKFYHDEQGKPTSYIDECYVLGVASNLLVVDDHNIVQFAHISVKECLQTSPDFREEFSDVNANIQIAASLLSYVLSSHSRFPEIPYSSYEGWISFTKYSILHWPSHCARAGKEGRQKHPLREHFKELMLGVPVGVAFQSWIEECERQEYSMGDWAFRVRSIPPNPYFAACIWGFLEVVNVALQRGPEVVKARNTNGQTGLHLATHYGRDEMVKVLLEKPDIDVNAVDEDQQTALHCAASRGYIEVVKALLNSDIDVNAIDKDQRTALHYAASCGYIEVVKALLEKSDIDVNATDRIQWTALHCAAANGDTGVVRALLKSDIDLNAADRIQWTALHYAASSGYIEVVKALLNSDIDVNAVDEDQQTALHCAASSGYIEVVKALLEKSEIVANSVDWEGRTALQRAELGGYVEIVEALERGGVTTGYTTAATPGKLEVN